GEHFHRVRHQLLGLKGASLDGLKSVHSHVHALNQCRSMIARLGLEKHVHADTAGAAEMIAKQGDPTQAAIASSLAAEIYELEVLASDVEDAEHNTTRFITMEREPRVPALDSVPTITSIVFQVRSVPAALFKALGGFATNGVNITKLESYLVGGGFVAAQFYADIEGHPDDPPVERALEELSFFTTDRRVLGTYAASPFREDPAIYGVLDPDPYKRKLSIV
ncbi:MAG: prephenate dehydratase domain-containing protein, partial [Pseudomonadota bacterium]